jgi:outer membrane protein
MARLLRRAVSAVFMTKALLLTPLAMAGLFAARPCRADGPRLTLAQAVERARAHQPTLAQARANTDAAEGRVQQARSGLLPQVNATATYQRTTGNFTPRPGATTTLVTPQWNWTSYNFFNFGISASQLIYDFGQTPSRKTAAEANRESLRATEQQIALQVVFRVQQAYFQVLAQQALVAVAKDAVANQQKHVGQIEGLVKAGLRPDIDLASVRTDLANARVQLINFENGVALARAQLDQQMGEQDGDYVLVDEQVPPIAGEGADVDPLVKEAISTRPELVSLARARQAQETTIRGLRGGYGPALSATAGATEAGTGLDRLVPNWVVGATLSWPLFQGGLTQGQLHEARAVLAGLSAQDQAQRLQVRVDVQSAVLAVRAAREAGIASEEATTNARELLRLAEGRYSNGLGNVIELGDAQVAFTNAAAQAVSARYNLDIARAQLLTALGR